MSQYLYLDIETIPTTDPDTIVEIERSITPPGNLKKAETIAEWEATQKPHLVTEAIAKTSFNGAMGRVCCIGWAWNDEAPRSVRWDEDTDEEGVIDLALTWINQERPEGYNRPTIVGHYVAGFDIRFLWQRAFVLGVKMPAFFPRDPKPWGQEVHDTMAMWCGAKDSISLDNLCKALGIPGKGNVTGADVAGMWARGEYDAIAAYCEADVERVRQVHRKMLVAYGERDAA